MNYHLHHFLKITFSGQMYSSGNPTNIANPIKDASARVDIKTSGGRLTLFETTLCEKISWEKLEARKSLDPLGYLRAYNEKDIQLICCQSEASTLWLVPPIVQARFIKSLRWNMDITFSWEFIRDRPKGKEAVKYELTILEQDLPKSSEVTKVFNGSSNSFTVFNIYPRYFRVTGSGDVRSLEQSVCLTYNIPNLRLKICIKTKKMYLVLFSWTATFIY